MKLITQYLNSSIGRKQIVAITGVLLVGFILGHLAGNMIFYLGPDAFNAYAKKLASLRPGLFVIEFGLLMIFVVHMFFTFKLVMENRKARGSNTYDVNNPKGGRSLATRLMPVSGAFLLFFVVFHLIDFTFTDKHGPRNIMVDGSELGLYGVVYNAFSNPLHSLLYILAMCALAMHLNHGIQSFVQTMGWRNSSQALLFSNLSRLTSIAIGAAYSSIPLYVLISNALGW